MSTALRATSLTLTEFLRLRFIADPNLDNFFDPALSPGTMVVSPESPQEMTDLPAEGLSVWLYRVERDPERLNAPPERISYNQVRRTPLPVRLHYLMTPIIDPPSSEREQLILGKVLQVFHDHPTLRGSDFANTLLEGTGLELNVRLEPLSLDELSKVYDALERSFQLSVSYEVSVVYIESETQPEAVTPVQVALPEYGLIVASEASVP